MSHAPRTGKGPLCMPRGGAGSHKAPSMCLMSKFSFLIQGLKWDQRQGQTAQESGEGQFHTAEGECFLPDRGPQHTQHNPSTHPAHTQHTLESPFLPQSQKGAHIWQRESRLHGWTPWPPADMASVLSP